MAEEWKNVPFADGIYQASSLGRVRSMCRSAAGRIIAGVRQPGGYVKFCNLRIGGRREQWWLHRLVAWVFHGPPPFDGAEVRHLDGNPANNRADNLAWGTHAENQKDIVRHGRAKHGEDNLRSTLTNGQAQEIVAKYREGGVSQRTLAKEYGVAQMTVNRILRGVKWGTVTGIVPPATKA